MFQLWTITAYLLHDPVIHGEKPRPPRFETYEECMIESRKYVNDFNIEHGKKTMKIIKWDCRQT